MESTVDNVLRLLDSADDSCLDNLMENIVAGNPCSHCAVLDYMEDNKTRLLSQLYALGKHNPQLVAAVVYRESMRTAMSALLHHQISEQVTELFADELEAAGIDSDS